jgi:hypothetical protein
LRKKAENQTGSEPYSVKSRLSNVVELVERSEVSQATYLSREYCRILREQIPILQHDIHEFSKYRRLWATGCASNEQNNAGFGAIF